MKSPLKLAVLLASFVIISCSENALFIPRNYPFVRFLEANITRQSGLVLTGEIQNISDPVIDHGFVVSLTENISTNLNDERGLFSLGQTTTEGIFTYSTKVSLFPGKIHFVRAYAKTANQTIISRPQEFVPDSQTKVNIIRVDPDGGEPGTEVNIIGEFFGLFEDDNVVTFGQDRAEIVKINEDTLTFIIPLVINGDYDMGVTVIGLTTIYENFRVQANFPVPVVGLQLFMDFDNNIDDKSGNVIIPPASGSPAFATDRHGNPNSAIRVDGIDDYINTMQTFDYRLRTLSVWIYPENINNPENQVILSQEGGGLNYGIMRIEIEDGGMNLWSGGRSSYYRSTVASNQWVHVVLVRGVLETKYYINNTLESTKHADGQGLFTPNILLFIGDGFDFQSSVNGPFQGRIDELAIYDRGLTEGEIDFLFNN